MRNSYAAPPRRNERYAYGLRRAGAEEADVVVHACPDPKTPVVFEVRREFE